MPNSVKKIANEIMCGHIGIMPTDTIYGMVGSVFLRSVVERIYELRKRDLNKPFIILISSFADLGKFDIEVDEKLKTELLKYWPGKVSVILPCQSEKFKYLHRGKNSLAFRLPDKEDLIEIIKIAGPIVAPSANPQGLPPAKNISEAKKYFDKWIDFYEDGGEIVGKSSKILEYRDREMVAIRN